ncbi:MAG TPA: 4'-phosphopantetheinyl transferase superfamily protein [Ignavibacteriaceae bacterium]|nr:4'-phosphopantetheinyl transferase superfamily protein [Ignavibacteriaceae bacterium]
MKPADIIFSYNKFGKPYISDSGGNLQFNISHCDNIIVFAFSSGNEIGVDVEKINMIEDMDGVADICFTQYEKDWLNRTESKTETFYKIWTIKEAFIKAIGRGFSFSPKDIELTNESEDQIKIRNIYQKEFVKNYQTATIRILADYFISLVYEGKKDVEIYNWNSDIYL